MTQFCPRKNSTIPGEREEPTSMNGKVLDDEEKAWKNGTHQISTQISYRTYRTDKLQIYRHNLI